MSVSLLRNSKGQTARRAAAAQLSSGFEVWRDYDGADGPRAYLYWFEGITSAPNRAAVMGRAMDYSLGA